MANNRVELIGRLVKDIEPRLYKDGTKVFTKNGDMIAHSSIAVTHSNKKGDVSFFEFVVYGDEAKKAMGQTQKGVLIKLVGVLRQTRWVSHDGGHRNRIEIRASEINPMFRVVRRDPQEQEEVARLPWTDDDGQGLDEGA